MNTLSIILQVSMVALLTAFTFNVIKLIVNVTFNK